MKLLATILAFLVSTTALAAFNFTISGRIQNPDGTLLNAPAVNFKVQVRSPNSDNCLLYEEIQTVPNITNGDFILRVGTGTRAAPSIDGGLPLASVLKNDKLLNLAAATAPCAAAVSTYTPLTNDNRKIYISFNDGSANGPQVLGTIDLNWTPLAIYADRANSTNQLQNTPVSLLPPSLNQVLQFDGINWTPTNPASALPFQAGSAGKVLGTDGSIASWVAAISTVLPSAQMLVGSSSNVATAVSMSGDASISNTGVLTLSPSGVTAGSVGSASAIPSFIVDSKGRVTTVSSQAYQDATALAKGIVQVGSNLTIAAGTLSLTGANVNSALGYTPASGALPTANIFVGSAGGMAVGVLVSGDISITSSGAVSLANSGVTAGTYGSANQVSQITVDTKGRVTSVLPVSINDSSKLPLAGGTMTGAISMGAFDITGSGSILMSTNKTFQVSNLTPAQQTTLIASLLPADAGKTWYNTGTNSLTYWNGTAVQQLATGSSSISNINGLTAATQSFAVGTSGTDFGVSSVGSTHTFNIPTASATNRGALASADYTIFNNKLSPALTAGQVFVGSAGNIATGVAISGDATLSNAGVLTINTSGVTAGAGYTKFSVDSKGRITLAGSLSSSDVATALAYTPVSNALTSGQIFVGSAGNVATGVSVFGDAVLSSIGALSLAASGVTAGSVGSASTVPSLTVDAKGRVTAISSQAYQDATALAKGIVQVGSNLTIAAGTVSLVASGVTGALGFTPLNKAGDTMSGALNMGTFDITGSGNILMSSNKTFQVSNLNPAQEATLTASLLAADTGKTWYNTGTNSLMYWNGTSAQQIATGTSSISSLNGLTTATQIFAVGTSGTDFGISSVGSTHTFNIPTATATNRGALSSADFTTFNNKLSSSLSSGQIFVGSAGNVATGVSLSGDATISNAGALSLSTSGVTAGTVGSATAVPSLTVDARGRVTFISSQAYADATGVTKGIVQVGSNLTSSAGIISLTSAGVTGALTYTPVSNALTSGQVFVGSVGNVATGVVISGDAALSNSGALTLANSGVTAGTSTKVTYDSKGRVTAGASLTATDIPALDASKITTGILPVTLGGTGAATADAALNNLLPTQTANSGKFLQTNGTNTSWVLGNSGTVTNVSGSGPISVTNPSNTPVISIATANTTTTGALTFGDWNIFNGKLSPTLNSAQIFVGSAGNLATGVTLSGDATISNTGTLALISSGVTAATYGSANQVSQITVDTKGRVTSATSVTINDNTKLPLAGGTMSGAIAMGNFDITGSGNILMSANKTFQVSNLTPAQQTTLVASLLLADAGKTWYNTGTNALMYWTGTSAQQLATGSSSISNINGLTAATQSFAVGTSGTDFGVSSVGSTHTFNIPTASATNRGALASADYTIFNNKLSSTLTSGQVFVGSAGNVATGVAISGDASISNSGVLALSTSGVTAGAGYTKFTVDSKGRITLAGALNSSDVTTALTYTPVSNALTSGNIYVGSAGNVATGVALSGDATISNAGVLSLAASGVTAGTVGSSTAVPSITVDAKGRVTAVSSQAYQDATGLVKGVVQVGSNLTIATGSISLTGANVNSALGYTPLNIAGDTMGGLLNMGNFDITGSGNILMTANKSIQISNLTPAQQTTLVASLLPADAGKTWYNNGTNSLMYWNGTSAQQIATGTSSISSLNGLTTATQSFAVGTSGTDFGISSVGSTHTFNIPNASATNRGVLASADFTAFNNKLNSTLTSAQIFVGSAGNVATGVALSGDATISNAGVLSLAASGVTAGTVGSSTAVPSITVDAKGRVTAVSSQAYQDATGVSKGVLQVGSNLSVAAGIVSLTSAGVTGALTYTPVSNSLTSGQVLVGSAGNVATGVAISGDATISNTGALTLANSGVAAGTSTKVTYDTKGRVTAGASLSATDIPALDASKITTGILPVTLGGTGAATVNGALNNILPTQTSNAGKVLGTDGTNTSWVSALTNTLNSSQIFVGNAGNLATSVSLSGDATLANTGALTLANSGVTAGTYGSANQVSQIAVDAKGRVTAASSTTINDSTKLPLAGGTMSGAINMGTFDITGSGNILMTSNKSFQVSNLTPAQQTILVASLLAADAGKTWFNTGTNSLMYWNGTSAQQIATGTSSISSLNGLTTPTQTFAVGTSGTDFGINSVGSTHTFNIPSASATNRGVLSSADFTTFNNKLSSTLTSAQIFIGSAGNVATGVSLSGDASISNAGALTLANSGVTAGAGYTKFTVDSKGRITLAGSLISSDVTTALTYTPVSNSLTSGQVFVGSAGNIATGIVLSGDATLSNAGALTLANSGVIAGTVGSSTAVPSLTVDAKGRVTSISSQAYTDATGVSKGIVQVGSNLYVAAGVVSLTSAGVTGALTYTPVSNALTSGNIYVGSAGNVATGVAISGDAALANSGALTLANSGVVAGTVGTAGAVPSLTVDAKGRVTAVSSQAYQDATGASKGIIQVGSNLSSAAGVISLTSAGVTGALTYAPLNKAGDTMSGALNMGTFDITGSGNILMSANKSIQISNLTPAQQTTLVASLLAADAGKTWFNTGTNSLMYWNGTSAQQVATGASSISNINGLTTATQSFAVGTSGTDFGISSVGSTHTFNIPNASATNRGVLASADFTAFNNKLNSTLTSAQIFVGSAGNIATGVIVSGDATISNTGVVSLASSGVTAGTSTKVTYDAKGRVTVGASLAATDIPSLDVSKITTGILPITLGGTGAATVSAALNNLAPVQTANAGKFLQTDGTNITWVAGNTGTVTNVSGSGPISVTNPSNTPVISIATANTTTTGALAFSDWNIFNGKLGSSLTSGNIFVGSAGNVATGVAVSGDATISNAGALTLANSGVIAGTVGSATAVPSLTVDAKGRVTSISSQAYADATGASKGIVQVGSNLSSAAGVISLTSAGVTGALTYTPVSNSLTSGQVFVGSAGNVATGVAISGDATISNTGALTLAASGIIAGTYNSVTVDAKGRATAASNVANSLNANQTLSNLTAPTSVNQNLIPLTDSTYNLGTAASKWQFIFTSGMAASANISANTFSLAGSGLNIGPSTVTPSGGVSNAIVAGSNGAMDMFVTTVNQTASTPSAAVRIESGNTVTANTGDVSLRAGVPSTSGSRGQIILNGSAINASASKIINLADPTLPQDSATKNYVDTRGFGSGTVTNVTGTAPISVATGTTTPSITIATANTTTTGALISADWNVFNGKLGSSLTSANIFVGSGSNIATGVALSGDATISNTGALTLASTVAANTNTKITYDAKGRVTAGTTLVATDIPALDAAKITTGVLLTARLGTGTQNATTYLRGDGTWSTVAGGATANAVPYYLVQAATAGPIVLSGTQLIDGVTINAGDRVLVKDQASLPTNGIYIAAAGAWTRATDMSTWTQTVGYKAYPNYGTNNAGVNFQSNTAPGGIIGSSVIEFVASGMNTANRNAFFGTKTAATSGYDNTAVGYQAGFANTTGYYNTAVGSNSIFVNTTGIQNTALGNATLGSSQTGNFNTAIGSLALSGVIANDGNTAIGSNALQIATGFSNIALGYNSGNAITTGNSNVIIGPNTGSTFATSSNNISINDGAANERIRVIASGNVGIGTAIPGAKLEVAGTVKLGTAGGVISGMGTCTIASTSWTTTALAGTCTGVPSTTAMVFCSPATLVTGQTFSALATAANSVNIVASAAGITALKCYWVQP